MEISLHPEALAERLTLSGAEVNGLSSIDGDWIFELEITPNRPDLLSHLGMAREIAAVLGRQFRVPRGLEKEFHSPRQPAPPFPITIEDPEGCRRYVGILIEGISVRPSPLKLAERLTRLGIRPVNNVVDATNFCMLELGQPLHAFDQDRLEGETIRVRRAGPKETIVTIDGVSRSLPPDALVIADARRPVALAGVMGGRETEISASTRRVLLESAWFDPVRIRRAVRDIKLSTDSSYRFERGVDPAMVPMAAMRAAHLIRKLSGGTMVGGLIDVGKIRAVRHRILLQPARVQEVLGMRIYSAQQRRFLERLGCRVTGTSNGYRVEPPSWRQDLRIPEDLYEELARLWGYDRCLTTLPPTARQLVTPHWQAIADPWVSKQSQIRQALSAAGMQEIMTYSLVHAEDHAKVKLLMGRGIVQLENPLSMDQAVLRNNLLIGALQTVARNLNRKTTESFQLFELGRVFGEDSRGTSPAPRETKVLGLLMGGTPSPAWGIPVKPRDIFHLKGAIEVLCERLRVHPTWEERSIGGPFVEPGLLLQLDGKRFGSIGKIAPSVLSAYEIPEEFPVVYAELEMDCLMEIAPVSLRTQPLPKIPPVVRDLAIVLSVKTDHRLVLQTIRESGKPFLKEAVLFDLYQGSQVPAGKKSLAFRLSFSAGDRTLVEEEVSAAHQKIVEFLKSKFQAFLR